MIKLYPSSTSFMKGRLVFTDYSSGCPRKIYLASQGVKEPFIPKHYAEMGLQHEDAFGATLSNAEVQRELPFKWSIPGTNAFISGRIDYVVNGEIFELKATDSKTNLTNIINGGRLKPEQLAQVAIYMMALEKSEATIYYGYYVSDKLTNIRTLKRDRTFILNIDTYGDIFVDTKYSGYNIADVLKFLNTVTDLINNHEISDRPHNWAARFGSPCNYCVFKSSCELHDSGITEGASAFVSNSKLLLGVTDDSK